MGSNFEIVKLGSLVKIKGGKRLPKGTNLQVQKNSHPYIRVRDMGERYIPTQNLEYVPDDVFQTIKNYIVNKDDLLISIVGTVGLVSIIDEAHHLSSQTENCAKLSGLKEQDVDYLYYFLTSNLGQEEIKRGTVGAVQAKLPLYAIENINVVWPNQVHRQRIANLMGSLDDKIHLNRQINQTLEQMAQALFKSWFVDFDPVIDNALDAGFFEQDLAFSDELLRRAEARKTVREHGDFKPQSDTTRQLFPAAFEECVEPSLGLGGWVPKGWIVSTTGDELTVKGGSTPSTANPEFWEGGHIHWTSPKDLSGNQEKVMLDTERRITDVGLNKITSGLLPIDTVLMSSRAPIGYLTLTKIPLAINQGYIAIPTTKRLSQEYVLYWLNSSMDEIKGIAGGTTFAEISKKTFNSISIIVPSKETIEMFSALTKSYLNKMTLNVVERTTLENLRDTLLPKLISGELRLDDIETDLSKEEVT
ncbi:restriction endonuclease subunit S [Aeromonas caviae]|uniref:restriction endonuclease subunit S n=1 Tax=Aeromonas caviae TaxID=648 RepID=UPI0038CFD909